MRMSFWRFCLSVSACVVLLAGCAGEQLYREGQELVSQGRLEEGVAKMEAAVVAAPNDGRLKVGLINRRAELANRLVAEGQSEQLAVHFDQAEKLYRRALALDAANERARDSLAGLDRARQHAKMVAEAQEALKRGEVDRALRLADSVLAQNQAHPEMLALKRSVEEQRARDAATPPTLSNLYKRPLTLEFRDANVRMIFEAISRTTGISFIVDKDVRQDAKATIYLRQSSLEDAIDLILQSNNLQKKVLSSSSVMVYPATPEKLKEYQDLVVRSFYLTNADVKVTSQLIKTIIKTKDIFIDEKLNFMVIRDTPEAIRLAERLVALHDLGESEVMLEVEVLEVQRTRLQNLGIQFPDQVGLTVLPPSGATTLLLSGLRGINSNRLQASIGATTLNFHLDTGDVNILANPRIRVKNREKAKILIGDRVPVITTTATATGFVSESVQYVDVGLKLDVEPTVSSKDDVSIKVALEVSSIAKQVTTTSGSLAYQIGTRNAATVLKLRDGETQVLAGLISRQESTTANRIPGIGELPIVGRLFGNTKDDSSKSEIILSITPRLIRSTQRLDAFAEEFYSGTETNLRTRPISLQPMKTVGVDTASAGGPSADGASGAPLVNSGAAPAAAAGDGVAGSVDPDKAPTQVSLAWQASTSQAKVGDTVKIGVQLKSDGNLRSLPFQVGFNPAVVRVAEVGEGGFFRQEGAVTSFSHNIDNAQGRVVVGISRSSQAGAKGEGSLATVSFKIIAGGDPGISILAASPIPSVGPPISPSLPQALDLKIGN